MSNHHHTNHQTYRPEDIDWDEIYGDEDQLWSGHVNGSLVVEAAGMTPGRALDVGCGEGADAMWLAERGWKVAAVDISSVAVGRARAEAASRGLDVDWQAADIIAERPDTDAFDLVSLHYPAFDIAQVDDTVDALTGAVAPGGTLLVVGHAPPNDPTDIEYDHADFVQPPDIVERLGDGWTIDVDEHRPREGDHHHGSVHSTDVVLRARKLLSG